MFELAYGPFKSCGVGVLIFILWRIKVKINLRLCIDLRRLLEANPQKTLKIKTGAQSSALQIQAALISIHPFKQELVFSKKSLEFIY